MYAPQGSPREGLYEFVTIVYQHEFAALSDNDMQTNVFYLLLYSCLYLLLLFLIFSDNTLTGRTCKKKVADHGSGPLRVLVLSDYF